MRKVLVVLTLAAITAALTPGASFAAGNQQSGPTVGNCISDTFYGNEPNIVGPAAPGGPAEQAPGTKAGRVVPSQSPGPKVTNQQTGEVGPGASVGDIHQSPFGPGSVPAICRALTS